MTETPFFFDGRYGPLFGILHQPYRAMDLPAIVFCHPLAEEKLWAHRVFVSFARFLADAGYPVLRFDYMGNGDSGGEFSESSLSTACADVRAAMAEVRQSTGARRVGLLGLRLGATIASLVAEETPSEVHHLILWSPILDGTRYMQELLRINLATQMAVHREIRQDRTELVAQMESGRTVNIDGYEMAWPLYSEVIAVRPTIRRERHQGPCLVVQIDRAAAPPAAELQAFAASHDQATLVTVREEPFWKEIPQFYQQAPALAEATLGWLKAW